MANKQYESESFGNLKIKNKEISTYRFIDCEFENCSFEEVKILHTTFINCKFQNCNIINIQTHNCESKNSEFFNCNIITLDWNKLLPIKSLAEPIYKFQDCFLKHNNFIEMKFTKFNFSNNTITESLFENCSLLDCDFSNCKLDGTIIINSNISKSDFRQAHGYEINPLNNVLTGSKFSFPEVINLLNDLKIKIDY